MKTIVASIAFFFAVLFAIAPPSRAADEQQEKAPLSRRDQIWETAGEHFARRRWQPAEAQYTGFRREYGLDEFALEALYRIGVCRQGQRDGSGAITAWRSVLRSPANRPAEREALKRALGSLFEALDQDRDRHERDQILTRLASVFPQDTEVTVRLHISEARRRLENADFTAAIRLFSVVESSLSSLDRQYLKLAQAHAGRGAFNPEMVLALADERLSANEPALAARFYAMALQSRPTPAVEREIRTKLGWSHYIQRELGDAEKHWRHVVANSPAQDPWRGRSRWHLIVLSAGEKSDVKAAVALCGEQALEFKGTFLGEQALFSQAWLLRITKQWKESKVAFDELVALYPRRAESPYVQSYIAEVEDMLSKKGE